MSYVFSFQDWAFMHVSSSNLLMNAAGIFSSPMVGMFSYSAGIQLKCMACILISTEREYSIRTYGNLCMYLAVILEDIIITPAGISQNRVAGIFIFQGQYFHRHGEHFPSAC